MVKWNIRKGFSLRFYMARPDHREEYKVKQKSIKKMIVSFAFL